MAKRKIFFRLFVILALLIALFVALIANGIIVFDRSAQRRGESVLWQGAMYEPCSGEYTEGKTIAKTTDGWQINEVEEDDSHTFIVIRSFLDQYLLVREDYEIPTSGKITTVFWNGKEIQDKGFHGVISELLEQATPDFQYTTEGIFQLTDGQHMRSLDIGYGGCPIGTEHAGYLGTVNDTWYLTTKISDDQNNPDGSAKPHTVWCYTVPVEYIDTLEKYFS